MKRVLIILLLVTLAQAINWTKVRPIRQNQRLSKPQSTANGRIFGGTLATTGQFPHQVGIFIDNTISFCSGSLISNNIVLTGALCVDGHSFFEIHAGALNISDVGEPGRVIVTSQNAKVHENFDNMFLKNDIAIIYLEQPVSGPNINVVRLPSQSMVDNDMASEIARISGWGSISDYFSSIVNMLRFIDAKIMLNSNCAIYYGSSIIGETTLCTSSNNAQVSTCTGDTGGPLTITESDGEITLAGIVSFGSSLGCEDGMPSVFTRVTKYLDWIIENTDNVIIRP